MMDGGRDGSLDDLWDCVVIGAGPAGTVAARQSALAGLKTLLVERQSFPRSKVCGACLNRRALTALNEIGLTSRIDQLEGVPIDSFLLRGFGGTFARALPRGVAVSRARLDAALLGAAAESGATVMTAVNATLLPAEQEGPFRSIRLQRAASSSSASSDDAWNIRAKVVITADGLGHSSLKTCTAFSDAVSAASRVGIGAGLDHADDSWNWVAAGCIYMAASRGGYGGLVRVEKGGLNLAAAVDPAFLRSQGSPHAAFDSLLRSAGFPPLPSTTLSWRGTPALSRMINRVVDHRVFVVGDAAGYVEPFTGEGIAWAVTGGRAVAESASLCVAGQCEQAASHWQRSWNDQIRRRQRWCRRLAWLLRHPTAAAVGVKMASRFPRITNRIVHQMNADAAL